MRVFAIPDTKLQIAVESFPHRLAMESFFWWFFTPSRTNLRWETFILNFFTDGSTISHTKLSSTQNIITETLSSCSAELNLALPKMEFLARVAQRSRAKSSGSVNHPEAPLCDIDAGIIMLDFERSCLNSSSTFVKVFNVVFRSPLRLSIELISLSP